MARRVLCAASREALEATAFRNLDGSVVAVVMNRSDAPIGFALRLGEVQTVTTLPARSIATYLCDGVAV